MRLRRRDDPSLEAVTYRPIGHVRSAPRRAPAGGWRDVESSIVIEDEFGAGLAGIEEYGHVWVVLALHGVAEEERRLLRRSPPGAPGEVGVFALRTQMRPNPIGISAVRLLAVEGTTLRVRGLDAIDGTSVLDIKPYIPYYDSVPDASVPDWIGHP
ncbi:MAG TPA: tRNA (N6-threonylcarbamoyladenosine(37)-N6)-methyltransferase TrmO [Dehalococcoidia bacterium]|nr:tRNA (N6-threonylcarbamoyladenosine(37)-N6)-methyltransferase TrmO [Dehalococcoidia bacterium]